MRDKPAARHRAGRQAAGGICRRGHRGHDPGEGAPPPFVYGDRGLLATIGRKAAVIAYRRLRLRGPLAWWLWGAAHIYFLVSLRNRVIVMTQWLWSYLVFERGARLITGLKRQ